MIRQAVVLAVVGSVAMLSAQAPLDQPKFDVASVRQNTSGTLQQSMAWPKGSFSAINMPLNMLIAQAYDIPRQLQPFTLAGGPADLLASRYDIRARLPETTPEGQHFPMLRSLLAERFKLRVHYESRPTPIYTLTVAREDRRLGPDLRASSIDCNVERERVTQRGDRLTQESAPRDSRGRRACWSNTSAFANGGAQTLANIGTVGDLVRSLQSFVDRPVTDATGLTGNFEWQVVFASRVQPNPDLPSVFTAVQEQLGLKLEASSGPFEVLVIDSVERPTPD
jgi:uncharacterized protein (TIGR03435 family)